MIQKYDTQQNRHINFLCSDDLNGIDIRSLANKNSYRPKLGFSTPPMISENGEVVISEEYFNKMHFPMKISQQILNTNYYKSKISQNPINDAKSNPINKKPITKLRKNYIDFKELKNLFVVEGNNDDNYVIKTKQDNVIQYENGKCRTQTGVVEINNRSYQLRAVAYCFLHTCNYPMSNQFIFPSASTPETKLLKGIFKFSEIRCTTRSGVKWEDIVYTDQMELPLTVEDRVEAYYDKNPKINEEVTEEIVVEMKDSFDTLMEIFINVLKERRDKQFIKKCLSELVLSM